jgi:hypothetical protein
VTATFAFPYVGPTSFDFETSKLPHSLASSSYHFYPSPYLTASILGTSYKGNHDYWYQCVRTLPASF